MFVYVGNTIRGSSRPLSPPVRQAKMRQSHLPGSELIPMLLQDDTHQLTARPDAGLRKELLKCGFDRALGDSDSTRNFLIRKTLEYAGEHLLFSLGEWFVSIFLRNCGLSCENSPQLLLVQPHLASHHVTDSLRKQRGRVTFQENPRNPRTDQFCCRSLIHACGHDQNLSLESLCLCLSHELCAIVLAEIEVEEYHVNGFLFHDFQSFLNRPAVSGDAESGLCTEESTYTFPEEGMIVQQQDVDYLFCGFRRSPPPPPRPAKATRERSSNPPNWARSQVRPQSCA